MAKGDTVLNLECSVPVDEVKGLVKSHVQLQLGCYFSEAREMLSGLLCTSSWIDDYYWNSFCAFHESDLEAMLSEVTNALAAMGRSPAFYVDPSSNPEPVAEYLLSKGFAYEEEIWMATDSAPAADSGAELTLQPVTPKDHVDFLRVFSQAFGGEATSADGYGDIPPEYLSALRGSLESPPTNVRHIHLLARRDGEAVGCGSVHIGRGVAGLYNVGTLADYRCRGVGTAISGKCIKIALDSGAERVFLQTQPDGSVQQFYEGIGCRILFGAAIFSREAE